jgi:hypothetical protein
MRHHPAFRTAALGLTLAALAPSIAAAESQDLRSPDAREGIAAASTRIDLRSPDAREGVAIAPTRIDVRSPDAREGMAAAPTRVDVRSPDAREGMPAAREAGHTPAALVTKRYLSAAAPSNPAAVTADSGPSWTAAILIGALLMVTAGGLGLLTGRASVRPRRIAA